MKIAVVGSREFKNIQFIADIVSREFNLSTQDILISGGARGVDSIAEGCIDFLNKIRTVNPVQKIIFLPDWNKYGKSAGFRRNELIINEAEKVIAFWDGKSKGTKHSIDLAIKSKKPIDIYIRY